MNTTVGIIVALPTELSSWGLKGRVGQCWQHPAGYVLICAGMGQTAASLAAQKLHQQGIQRWLLWGYAGGVSPFYPAGRLVMPSCIVTAQKQWPVSWLWPHYQQQGCLWSVERPLMGTADKEKLYQQGAVVVDMESAAIAKQAAQYHAQFAVVRAVVDVFDQPLPPSLAKALNHQGRVTKPWYLWRDGRPLWLLAHHARQANRGLNSLRHHYFISDYDLNYWKLG